VAENVPFSDTIDRWVQKGDEFCLVLVAFNWRPRADRIGTGAIDKEMVRVEGWNELSELFI